MWAMHMLSSGPVNGQRSDPGRGPCHRTARLPALLGRRPPAAPRSDDTDIYDVDLGEGNDTATIAANNHAYAAIYGGKGNDVVYGGPGKDILSGGPGVDRVYQN